MSQHNSRKILVMCYRKQSGFTLVELLVVMGIIGVLSGALAMTFGLVMKTSAMAMEQNSALNQVHMAGSWISRDIKNAYAFPESTTDLCSMNCREGASFDNYTITYKIEDSVLMRTRQKLDPVGAPETIIVARSIDADHTSFIAAISTENYYRLTVTAYNNQSNSDNITRIYKLKMGY